MSVLPSSSKLHHWIIFAVFLWVCCAIEASAVDALEGHLSDSLVTSDTQTVSTDPAIGGDAAIAEELTTKFSVCGMFQRCDLCVKPHLVRGINPFTDIEQCVWDKVTHTCRSATLPWDKARYDCETHCRGANSMLTSLPHALFPHRLCELHVCPYVTSPEVCPLTQDQQLARSIVTDVSYLGDAAALDRLAALHLLGKTLLPRMRDASELYRHAAATFLESQSTTTANAEVTVSKSALRHATSVNALVSQGVRDALGGLAYSIAKNLFNRVRLSDCDANYRRRSDRFGFYLNAARRCPARISSGSAKGCLQWQAFMEEPSKCDTDFPSPKTVVYTAGAAIKQRYRRAARSLNIASQLHAAQAAYKLVTDKDKAAGDSELLTIAGLYALAQTAPPGVTISHVVERFPSSMDTYQAADSPSFVEATSKWPKFGRFRRGRRRNGSNQSGKSGKKKMIRRRALHEHHYLLVGSVDPQLVKPSDAASAQHTFIIDFWAAAAGGPRYAVHDIPFTPQGDTARVGVSPQALEALERAVKRGGKLPKDPNAKAKNAGAKKPSKAAQAALAETAFGTGLGPATQFVDAHHSPHVARHNLKRAERVGMPLHTGHYRGGGVGGLSPATAGSSAGEGAGVVRAVVNTYSQRGHRERYAIRIKHERVQKALAKAKAAAVIAANASPAHQGKFEERLGREKRRREREKENWLRRWRAVRKRQGLPQNDPRPSLVEAQAEVDEESAAERAYVAQAKFRASRADQSLRAYLNSIYGFDSLQAEKLRGALALNRALLDEELSGKYTMTAWEEQIRSAANLSNPSSLLQVQDNPQAMQAAQHEQSLLSDDTLREIALHIDQHVAALMEASQIGDATTGTASQQPTRLSNQPGLDALAHASARASEAMNLVLMPSLAHAYSPASNAKDLELAANLVSRGSLEPFHRLATSPKIHDARPRVFALITDAARVVKLVRALQIVQNELDTPGASGLTGAVDQGSVPNFNLNDFVNTKTDVFAHQRQQRRPAQAAPGASEPLATNDLVYNQAKSMLNEMWALPDASARRIELGRRAAFAEHLYQRVCRTYDELAAEGGLSMNGQSGGLLSLLEADSAAEHEGNIIVERSTEDMLTIADEISQVQADLQDLNMLAESLPSSNSALVEVQASLSSGASAHAELMADLQAELNELRLAAEEEEESAALRAEERDRHAELVAHLLHGEEGRAALLEASQAVLTMPESERLAQSRATEAELGAKLREEREILQSQWLTWLKQDQTDLENVLGSNLTPQRVLEAASKLDVPQHS